jgi:hypothetical protein
MAGAAFAVVAVLDGKFNWPSTTSQTRESNIGNSLGMVLTPSVAPSMATGFDNTHFPTTMSETSLPSILSSSDSAHPTAKNPIVSPSSREPSKRKSITPSHLPSKASPAIVFEDNKSRHPNPLQVSLSSKEPTLSHAVFGSPTPHKSPITMQQFKQLALTFGLYLSDNIQSPLRQALEWSLSQSTPASRQRIALATLFFSSRGKNWTDALSFLSEDEECRWNAVYVNIFKGVLCNEYGQVETLALCTFQVENMHVSLHAT